MQYILSIFSKLIDWAMVARDSEATVPVQLKCYQQLDDSFASAEAEFVLSAGEVFKHRPCALRIPSGVRVTVVEMSDAPKKVKKFKNIIC